MTVILEIPSDLEGRIQSEAALQEIPIEDFLVRLVTDAVSAPDTARRQRSLELLRSLDEVGSEEEQRETFDYLKTAVDENRLSDRKRFAS